MHTIVSFINEKYVMEMTAQRRRLVKKRIKELQENGQLVTVTGKGIAGHFRVSNKRTFKREVINQNQQAKSRRKAALPNNSDRIVENDLITPTTNNNSEAMPSIFKTPSSRGHLSTANSIVNTVVTQAPRLAHIERVVEKRFNRDLETPRSSLSKRRRM